MRSRLLVLIVAMAAACSCAQAKGKLIGNAGGGEREVVAYSASKGLAAWTITDPSGEFEFSLDPGDYMVSCGGQLAPYVCIVDGKTTTINHSDQPSIEQPTEMWTPACRSFGQTYVATGTAVSGLSFWMPQGSTAMRFSLREDGPNGKLVGESVGTEKCDWITGFGLDATKFPTVPGKRYYAELASTENIAWTIAMPKGPDPYDGGIAYFDGIPHPESDLALNIGEVHPAPVTVAAAQADQHFIEKGPGSGDCVVAGQSFVATKAKNVLTMSANCGFGGGATDFIFAIKEGGPDGKVIAEKAARMVSDWGSTAYFEPDEVTLTPGAPYYFEYRRADGKKFYSYLSADTYAEGKAYRDGKEVEGFDQLFDIVGEIEPGGITYPYNVKISDITASGAKVTWDTGTAADGTVLYGEDPLVRQSVVANDDLSKEHSAAIGGLKPATVYYYRVVSWTRKEGASKAYSRISSFVTPPAGPDEPKFDKPDAIPPVQAPGPRDVAVVNGSFEEGLTGWKRCSVAKPKESKDYPIGNGPFGSANAGTDGYKPHSGKSLYGWSHLGADDPNPTVPREDWKQELIGQPIKVQPGHKYLLKAWILTGDRGSGWGRDGRVRLCVDTGNKGLLDSIDASGGATATQWFATENEWKPVSLHFTAEKDTAVIGVHFLQWWALDADYLYVDDVSVEDIDE